MTYENGYYKVLTMKLKCDMMNKHDPTCGEIAYVDNKGFVYCGNHGPVRKQYCPCRKLRPAEAKKLEAGQAIKY